MVAMSITPETIWKALDEVVDPEIPVVSLVEMGVVRAVDIKDDIVTVTITPTFAGCPALQVMGDDIKARLSKMGIGLVEIEITFSPAWTSDWITESAREKLKGFGLAPPPKHGGDFELVLLEAVVCPYCDSTRTEQKNSFGPTACRAIYFCHDCIQPFEQFKPL